MNKLVVAGIALIVVVGALSLSLPDRRLFPLMVGAMTAVALLTVRWLLARDVRIASDDTRARDPGEALRRWLARTENLVQRAESSRSDWDKHLRPMLARQFELASGQRKAKDPSAFRASALMVFGQELWAWVDPDNVDRSGGLEPGPGRAVLNDVLERLEQL
ncbi:MAG: hypothetical protein JWR34_4567 [Mycobacterium sp.]|jgi:hypothetical protein|nr:hypothetical protein [Mycobacterium sp.]